MVATPHGHGQRSKSPIGSRINIALLGFSSIATGMIAAMESVPGDITDPSALFWPALYMTIGLIVPIVIQGFSNLMSVFRIENIMMIGIIYWLLLDMLQSAYTFAAVSSADVLTAFGMVGAFALAVWFGASGRGWKLPRGYQAVDGLDVQS